MISQLLLELAGVLILIRMNFRTILMNLAAPFVVLIVPNVLLRTDCSRALSVAAHLTYTCLWQGNHILIFRRLNIGTLRCSYLFVLVLFCIVCCYILSVWGEHFSVFIFMPDLACY